ncbi:UNVERIFIED_CONTAM: hypothetical protein PYX00_003674 [Menopon gallinae]|uniref:Prefoldin subunit 2 n=1 Tax=Menopon gallinae TaxID=328185 RepID=A0AAW2I1Z7_9NEOP
MSQAPSADLSKKKTLKPRSQEEIVMGFQKLRGEQRYLSNKITELEIDLHEHKVAMDTLKDLDGGRRCFKLVGGILCERTVQEVLPEVQANLDQLTKVIESLNQQLVVKGTEINAYKDEHNIVFKNVEEVAQPPESEPKSTSASSASVIAS